jgi:hypothetical protein
MVSRTARTKWRLLPLVMAMVGAGVLLGMPSSSEAAWDGTQDVRLGDQIVAEFRAGPYLESHKYPFYATKDTQLSATVAVDPTAKGLVPELRLFTAMDVPVDLGAAQVGAKVKNFKFAASGDYYLQVRATTGTGIYKIVTKVKCPKVISGAETTGSFTIDACYAGTLMSVTVKPTKGSSAAPKITALAYPGGTVNLGSAVNGTKLSKIVLPVNGTYTLTIDNGTAGQSVDVKAVLAAPRFARLWAPGFVEDPAGLPTENRTKWLGSAHADHTATAFNDWNDSTTLTVPNTCARCHTTTGYLDYIGADGTPKNDWTVAGNSGKADNAAPIGQVITCDACHNDAASTMTSVMFPSGRTVTDLGKEARCMTCHQGRESTTSVEAKIVAAAPATLDDTMVVQGKNVTFMNVHYLAAGATLYGTEAMGGYEYANPNKADPAKWYPIQGTTLQPRLAYESKFTHVGSRDTCLECHDAHSTEVKLSACATCHVNASGNPVASLTDLRDIRMAGTTADFDGDGNLKGVYYEIAGMRTVLLTAIQDYANATFAKKIAYNESAYPYWFLDANGDGVADETEAVRTNGYPNWSARMLRAAYNYQFSLKDPGAFAHNAKYVIELLYDSIADMNAKSAVTGFDKLVRNDSGHFDGAAEPFRHWDEEAIPSTPPAGGRGSTTGTDQLVDAGCARCHSPNDGFIFIATNGIYPTIGKERTDGFKCESCHVDGAVFTTYGGNKPERRYIASVTFPYVEGPLATSGTSSTTIPSTQSQISAVTIFNGAKGTSAQDDSFVCMTCHRARESKLTLDAGDPTGATATWTLSFKNSHYLGGGASLYGSKAAVMYQYPGKPYAQRWDHDQGYANPYPATAAAKAQCTFCHMQNGSHTFEVEVGPGTACSMCHPATTVEELAPFGRVEDNYDNDTSTKPKAELGVFQARLLAAIQKYCKDATDAGTTNAQYVAYNGAAYPYFVKDTNKNGVWDAGETTSIKGDTKVYRATFNYNFSVKEPGCWAHNPKYVLQVLFDSIEDLGGDTGGLNRPN